MGARTGLLSLLLTLSPLTLTAEAGSVADKLKAAPPNAWVKIHEFKTGGRASPMFFYEPKMKKFFLTGGRPGGGYGKAKRHFDTEIFDPATCSWTNAYPDGAPYNAKSGVTDAPAHANWRVFFKPDKNGVSRIAMFGTAYGTCSRTHYQWAYDYDSGKLLALLYKQTASYDVKSRKWTVTGAGRIAKGGFAMIWGSFCYDPVNKEVVSVGGASAERGGTPGTWVYKVAANKWEKLKLGSDDFGKLRAEAERLRRDAWTLVGALRNRYYLTETAAEAKAKPSDRAKAVEKALGELSAKLKSAKLKGAEAAAAKVAAGRLGEAIAALKKVSGRLDGKVDAALIAAARPVWDALWLAERALDAEPTGRAGSQMAFDAASGKIVLFGGSGQDRCMSDTWLYDAKTRKWEQRWPEKCPSPRQGHAMVYLPKSKRVALVGGHTIRGWFARLPHEIWTYDIGKNKWKLLLAMPALKRRETPQHPTGEPRGEPYGGASSGLVAAAGPDDAVVAISTGGKGRTTWACKLDPSRAAGAAAAGVKPGALSYSMLPADYDKAEAPGRAKMDAFLKKLPVNQWISAPKIPKRPSWRAWNTTAYDPDRQQFLLWGGGHVTYMGTEVSHYSVKSGLWNIGYSPDIPHAPTGGFYVKAALSFKDRPQVPVHAYQAYAYDPPSGKMLYLNRAYDVVGREWDPEPYPGLKHKGCMRSMLETTPGGAFCYSEHGMFKFEAKTNKWKAMPWNGPKFGRAWCDGHAMCYDSKRDCLWMAHGDVFKYDIKTGTVEKLGAARPGVLGKFALWREQVHIPEADLILVMRMFKAPDGKMKNIAWDPQSRKYFFVELPFVTDGKPKAITKNPFSWSQALHYDPKLKVAILNTQRRPWFLRFDRKTAKMDEAGAAPATKKK